MHRCLLTFPGEGVVLLVTSQIGERNEDLSFAEVFSIRRGKIRQETLFMTAVLLSLHQYKLRLEKRHRLAETRRTDRDWQWLHTLLKLQKMVNDESRRRRCLRLATEP